VLIKLMESSPLEEKMLFGSYRHFALTCLFPLFFLFSYPILASEPGKHLSSADIQSQWETLRRGLPLEFVSHPAFVASGADGVFRTKANPIIEKYLERKRNKRPSPSTRAEDTPQIPALFDAPLFTSSEEAAFFMRMNYLLFYANQSLTHTTHPGQALLTSVVSALAESHTLKNTIIEANTRFVKWLGRSSEDFLGEGMLTLIRSVERFDVFKANTFATYLFQGLLRKRAVLFHKEARRLTLFRDAKPAAKLALNPALCPAALALQNERLDRVMLYLNALSARDREVLDYELELLDFHDISQADLAHRLGVTTRTIYNIRTTHLDGMRSASKDLLD
jgi:RNA polymerase sigma factor (sigma-70 family)